MVEGYEDVPFRRNSRLSNNSNMSIRQWRAVSHTYAFFRFFMFNFACWSARFGKVCI